MSILKKKLFQVNETFYTEVLQKFQNGFYYCQSESATKKEPITPALVFSWAQFISPFQYLTETCNEE